MKKSHFLIFIISFLWSVTLLSACGMTPSGTDSESKVLPSVASTNDNGQENFSEKDSAISLTDTESISFSEEKQKEYEKLQASVDDGHKPGLLDPEQVGKEFLSNTLKLTGLSEYHAEITYESEYHAAVILNKDGSPALTIELYQPVKKGKDGIWVVISWLDSETNSKHTVE